MNLYTCEKGWGDSDCSSTTDRAEGKRALAASITGGRKTAQHKEVTLGKDLTSPIDRRKMLKSMVTMLQVGMVAKLAQSTPTDDHGEFRGIFPVLQTPYRDDDTLDFDSLGKEVAFLHRARVHGIVWPQRASEYMHLTFDERTQGAELIANANKGKRTKLVLGVQGPDIATALRYAKHAETVRPDAIIALPTRDNGDFDLGEVARYYRSIADVCSLPLFVQTTGNMSVEFVLKMASEIPTLRFVKDEAGNSIARMKEFRVKDEGRQVAIFTGDHGRNLTDEIERGVAGNMPAAGFGDLYVKVWDLWHAGRFDEALDMFSKILLFVTQASIYGFASLSYLLYLRGIFSNWRIRRRDQPVLDDLAQKALRRTYEFVKPALTK